MIQNIEGLDKLKPNITVGALEQLRQKDRWLGTEYGGCFIYDSEGGLFSDFSMQPLRLVADEGLRNSGCK